MTYSFDAATAIERAGAGSWHMTIAKGWDVAGIPNGGYLAALLATGMLHAAAKPDPVIVDTHYLERAEPGPVEIRTEVMQAGRRLATVRGDLMQRGRRVVTGIATVGDLDRDQPDKLVNAEPPDLPPPEECEDGQAVARRMGIGLVDHVELRIPHALGAFARGEVTDGAAIGGWARFRDGRPPDSRSLPLLADAFPPTVFNIGLIGWMPTVQLSVQVRRRPAPGWIACWFETRFVTGGMLEVDGTLWDSERQPVALARQLALEPRTDPAG